MTIVASKKWFVYMIEADDGSLYTGITTNVEKRFQTHADKKGAKYFYSRRPICVRHVEEHPDRSSASKREYAIKKLTKKAKLALIDSNRGD